MGKQWERKMLKAKTLLLAAMLAQIALTDVQAEPLACYTQFGDVWLTRFNNSPVLLPYHQCLRYMGHDGVYIRVRAVWSGLTAEGRIFAGDVYCGPGSCLRSFIGSRY